MSIITLLLCEKMLITLLDLNSPTFYLEIVLDKDITVGSSPPVTVEERVLLDGPLCC